MFEPGFNVHSLLIEAALIDTEADQAAAAYWENITKKYPSGELPESRHELLEELQLLPRWLHSKIGLELKEDLSARYRKLYYAERLLHHVDYETYLARSSVTEWRLKRMYGALSHAQKNLDDLRLATQTRLFQANQQTNE